MQPHISYGSSCASRKSTEYRKKLEWNENKLLKPVDELEGYVGQRDEISVL